MMVQASTLHLTGYASGQGFAATLVSPVTWPKGCQQGSWGRSWATKRDLCVLKHRDSQSISGKGWRANIFRLWAIWSQRYTQPCSRSWATCKQRTVLMFHQNLNCRNSGQVWPMDLFQDNKQQSYLHANYSNASPHKNFICLLLTFCY